jgi:hypothetical protein
MTPFPSLAENPPSDSWHKRVFSKSTNPKSNLWAHIQGNLDIDTNASNPSVKKQYKWYSQNTDYLSRTLARAQPYLYHIVAELEARNLPLALALVPLVESDYDPTALSPRGAAGLWQLMPATARHLGVKRNSYYDGRHDLQDSTRAAIDYLTYLNNYFDGDWLLALAAYNAGEGTVLRAIRNNERAGKDTDFWSLSLPQETRLYVPKILALAEVISNPRKVDLELPFVPHAPIEKAPLKKSAREKITYRVRRGDSFSKIASQFHVSQADLKSWNALGERHLLKAGENLVLYVKA